MILERLVSIDMALSVVVSLASILAALGMYMRRIRDRLLRDVTARLDRVEKGVLRNGLLTMYATQPLNAGEIEAMHDEYVRLGGNGYVEELHRAWRGKHARLSPGSGA